MQPEHEAILAAVEASRHYACLSPALVRRIVAEEYPRYRRDKERVKAVKNRLHQHFGAYIGDRSHQAAARLLDDVSFGDEAALRGAAMRILNLHASSRERLAHMEAVHALAFAHAPAKTPLSIMDIGCGFHPFTIPWMSVTVGIYHAVDIDTRTEALLNRFFALLGLPETARTLDILSEPFADAVDVALLLKVLPVMEAQRQGSGQALLEGLNARLAVVSYPTRSLCGRAKGMPTAYAAAFEGMELPSWRVVDKEAVGEELVFVLESMVCSGPLTSVS